MLKRLFLTIAILSFLIVPVHAVYSNDAINYYNRGIDKYELGQYTEAIKDFDKAISLYPNFAEAYSDRGNCLIYLKNYNAALADFNKAISIDPNYDKAYIGKANVFIDMGSYTSALEIYEKIIKLNPNNVNVYKTRDDLLEKVPQPEYNTSNMEDATKIYKECVDSVVFVVTNKGTGSGVIVKEDGTFVTCYHVIDGVSTILVKTNDGRAYRVNGYKHLNKEQDIAILTLDTNNTFKPIQFPLHKSLEIGSKVYTISNPKGVQFTFSDGMLSQEYQGKLQFTAPVSSGSSGGALLDEHGHLIGIIKSQIIEGQNINFAISNEVYYYMLNNPTIYNIYNTNYSDL